MTPIDPVVAGAVRPLVDQAERERIRTSLDESLVVEAAAGTGKTTELVRRLINVLAEGRGAVQTVVAVTFTEKAAGELKLRLRAGLEHARREAPPETGRRAHLERAIAQLEEARISTIHGLCKDLLQERPVEARVDPRFQVLDEAESQALFRHAFDGWLEQILERPPEGVRRALRRGIRRRSDESPTDRLRQTGWTLAGWRDLRARWRRPDYDRNALIDELVGRVHELAARLRSCADSRERLYRDMWRLRRLSDDLLIGERLQPRDHDGLEAAMVELSEDRSFRRPKSGSGKAYGGTEALEAILASHAQLLGRLDDFARLANADLAALLHGELGVTLERYEAFKARAGRLDFFDLLLRTRDLVRDRQDVRSDLHQRFTHLFVDEFQDTDPLQAEIVLLLASREPAVDRWREVVPVPGKLFIVGDPKQSIYRFRRADVGTYQEVKQHLSDRGVACLELRTSFRSVPSIQHLVNAAFAPLMIEDRRTLQAGYVPLAPHREERPAQPGIVALPVPRPYGPSGLTKSAVNESLPDAVAAFVQWLVADSGWQVTERDRPGEVISLAARHICLLFRRFSSFAEDVTRPFVEALEARGVPHLLVGGKSLHLRDEVEVVRTALTALEWPDDELSLYATLKGPLFAISDEELLEYRRRFRRLHPYRLPGKDGAAVPERLTPVVEGLALLRELHRRRNSRPVEETVRALLGSTRAHVGFVLRPWGEQALANVMRIAELARRYEAAGSISFRGFVEQLREEAEGEAPEATIIEESSDGVRLMTVHRAKGLEFPVVVLADVTANITSERPSRHTDPGRGLCAVGLGRWVPLDLLDHEAEEHERDRAEGVRVAYVAATRARDLLVVPAIGDDPFERGLESAENGWVAPVQRSLYPEAARRRAASTPPGCPAMGEDSVLDRWGGDGPGRDTVRPGLHRLGSGDHAYEVVWWDPSRLRLGVKPLLGLRRRDLLEDPGQAVVDGDRARYEAWETERRASLEHGARPSLAVQTVTDLARQPGDPRLAVDPAEVAVVVVASGIERPAGLRFGTLVHAVLAVAPLDASDGALTDIVALEARILGATSEEERAALAVAASVLAHPLLARASEAWKLGRCRRETPVAAPGPAGVLVEGVLDLAFEDEEGWTVVDFKTTAQMAGALERYRRQVALYVDLVGRVTGRPARGVLMQI